LRRKEISIYIHTFEVEEKREGGMENHQVEAVENVVKRSEDAVLDRCRSALSALADFQNTKDIVITTETRKTQVVIGKNHDDEDEDDDMSTEEEDACDKVVPEMPKPISTKTPEKKINNNGTPKKSVEYSPVLKLEGDYEDDAKMMTQEQVDVIVKKECENLKRTHYVEMSLLEDQLKEALADVEKMKKKQEETESIVSQFEQVCVEVKENCSQRLHTQMTMFSELTSKTKRELEEANAKISELSEKHKLELAQKSSTITRLEKEIKLVSEERSQLSEKCKKHVTKLKLAEKHRLKCDERYTEHMEQAQTICQKEKNRRAEVEAAYKLSVAECSSLKEKYATSLASLETSKKMLNELRDENRTLQEKIVNEQEIADTKSVELEKMSSAMKQLEQEFKKHKLSTFDQGDLYKELTQALLEVKREKAKTDKLTNEKAEVFAMCEDLMQQLESKNDELGKLKVRLGLN